MKTLALAMLRFPTLRLLAAGLLLVLALAATTFSPTATAATADDGFVDLLDGKDLDGWVVEGRKTMKKDDKELPIWTVEDGRIVCAGNGYGFLRYDKEFGDCVLHLEYQMSKGCNSGVGIRTVKFEGPGNTRPSAAGYEIQILDDAGKQPGTHSSGSLYRYVAPKVNASLPAGEWNVMEIELRGPKIKVTLNGQVIHDLDQTTIERIKNKPTRGYFCIQNHGRHIEYRNLRAKEL